MIGRLIQLISRFLSKGLFALAGLLAASPEQTEVLVGNADAIAAAVGAVLLSILDLGIHKMKTGGVMVPAGENEVGGPSANGLSRMLLVLVLVGAGFYVSGCAAVNPLKGPSQRKIDLYDAEIRASIVADAGLSAEQKSGRLAGLEDYQAAVDAAPPAGRWAPGPGSRNLPFGGGTGR